jgi:hypothetical protein
MPDGPYEPERDRIEVRLGGTLLRARAPPALGEEAPVLFVAYLRHRARRLQRPWSGALAGAFLLTASRPTLACERGACLRRCGACHRLSVLQLCSAFFVWLTNAGTEPLTAQYVPPLQRPLRTRRGPQAAWLDAWRGGVV